VRSPRTLWQQPLRIDAPPPSRRFRCDVLIVGAGITGALVAERLTRAGRQVVLIEREDASHGSTAASTAMILWEIDRSLAELTELYGLDRARRDYCASYIAANGLQKLAAGHRLACQVRPKPSLYLAAADNDRQLRHEFELRRRVGLPGEFLDHRALLQNFGIARSGAIISPGAADADPVLLTRCLLQMSRGRGARIYKADATTFGDHDNKVFVGLDQGQEIEARHVVLATGYALPDVVQPTIHSVASSWVIATSPQPQNVWRDEALIWEDSQDYNYARTTVDGRIIFGGEDDTELVEPDERDAAIPAKASKLAQKLKALWPRANLDIDYKWSGMFDTTCDGLPLIGRLPGRKNMFAAYGYGGNGITFSYLAAELISTLIAGGGSPLMDDFAIDR
jgi:glycine/D-amino acid oxidase-like deaminating enzyme